MKTEELEEKFNNIYNATCKSCQRFVTYKCNNITDIPDILQEIFLEVYQTLERKGTEYIVNPEAFVIMIAKNKISKHYKLSEKIKSLFIANRNQDSQQNWYDSDELIDEESYDDVDDMLINQETLRWMWSFLKKKPDQIQKAFYLYYYLDEKISTIAEKMDQKESTIKNWIFRTRNELRELYWRGEEE